MKRAVPKEQLDREYKDVIKRGLTGLREAWLLRKSEGMTIKELAVLVALPEGQVSDVVTGKDKSVGLFGFIAFAAALRCKCEVTFIEGSLYEKETGSADICERSVCADHDIFNLP